MPTGPSQTDVMIAVTGAAGVLGGLVLVFLGILVTTYQGLLGRLDGALISPYKRASTGVFAVFALALADAGGGVWWLVSPGSTLYHVTLVLFAVQLIGLAVAALYSTFWVLLRG